MKDIPILITDLMRAFEKLPDPKLFKGPHEIIITIKDSVTSMDRHILFRRREVMMKHDDKEAVPYWTLWQNVAVDVKNWKEKK